VPTVVAFRTVLQAQRARQVMNETWRYDAWGQVIVMMPLKQLAKDQSTGMHLKATHPYGAASTSLGWMYAKSGKTTPTRHTVHICP
jgi:hypothetical protein